MKHQKFYGSVALPALVLSLTLSACAPVAQESQPSASSPSAIKTETPEVIAPKLATFTFPDGHISFEHPVNWTIKTVQGLYLNEADKAKSVEAHIYDETGRKIAVIASGGYGGGAAGPESLTILDSQPLPGFPALQKGGKAEFAFIHYANENRYFMGVMDDRQVTEGNGSSGSPYLLLGNGAAIAMVEFNPNFQSLDEAKDWMKDKQYGQLKAMLTSLDYA